MLTGIEKSLKKSIFYMREDNPIGTYRMYGINEKELEDYPDEFDYAQAEGFL